MKVSVVICTLGRSEGALQAVRSVLKDDPTADVVLVDQNESNELAALLASDGAVGRARIVKAPPNGIAAARNAGVRACGGLVIAFTDDDCEVREGWLAAMTVVFARDPRIALVFGTVEGGDFDRSGGFVPSYEVRSFVVAEGVGDKARIEGIGACMAVRRTAWDALGGFDESLGTGGPFRSGEETDFAMRALLFGWRAAETPSAKVIHHGFRSWEEGRALVTGYMYGLGATNMKMLRLAPLRATRPLAVLAWRWLARAPLVDLNHRPPRIGRMKDFLRGALDGLRLPLTEGSRHFERKVT